MFFDVLLMFTFSHLADSFIQSDLQMRTIEAINTNNMQAVYVSLLCSPRLHLFDEKHSKTVTL